MGTSTSSSEESSPTGTVGMEVSRGGVPVAGTTVVVVEVGEGVLEEVVVVVVEEVGGGSLEEVVVVVVEEVGGGSLEEVGVGVVEEVDGHSADTLAGNGAVGQDGGHAIVSA
jgi:hypothetical protein